MVLKILISLLHWCFLSKTIFLSCKTISINFRSFLHFSICLLYTASSVLPSVRRICWISTYKWFQNDAYWFLLSFSQSESRTKIINLKSCLKAVFIVSSKPNFIDPGAISYFRLDGFSNRCYNRSHGWATVVSSIPWFDWLRAPSGNHQFENLPQCQLESLFVFP